MDERVEKWLYDIRFAIVISDYKETDVVKIVC